ncbi:tripartite tricarboxylate transporter substrate binding protein [soil metagenome]
MDQTRRRGLAAALGVGAGSMLPAWAQDQTDWPTRPVKVVVAFTAGGTTDILARSVSQQLSERWKQSFIIDNRTGGGGNIGTEFAARSAPDGYTFIVNSVGPMAVNLSLYKKLAINPLTDLVPVVQIADVPNMLVVNPGVPAKTVAELVAYGKAHPAELNYCSTGVGTSSHLAGFMLGQRGGFVATHVPYKGADALNDLLAGRIQFMFATIPSAIQHIRAGALRALAVSSVKRSRSMPDVPTVAESGFPGFEAGSWFGFFAPKGTPAPIMAKLNGAVNDVLRVPAIGDQMIREGADPVGGTAEQFGKFVHSEYEKWKIVVRDSGATVDG